MRRSWAVRVVLAAILLSAAAHAQDTPEVSSHVLHVSTRIVSVDVVATDRSGHSVPDLTRQDFRILEDGKPQSIKSIDRRTGGGLVVPLPELKPGTATNIGQETSTPALHVILFDALNTAPSDLSFARQQLKKLMADFPAGTRVAIFALRGDLHLVQGFTTDTRQLMTAVDKQGTASGPWFSDPETVFLSGSVGTAGNSIADTMAGSGTPGANTGAPTTFLQQNAARDEASMTQSLRVEKTLRALSQIANYLHTLPGRKNLLWLSGTFPVDLLPDVSTGTGSNNGGNEFNDIASFNHAVQQMALTMELGDIAVYPVQVTGVAGDLLFGGANGSRPSPGDIQAMAGARIQQHQVMDDIAYETGGRAIYDDNDLKGAITQAINQGSDFYTLTYSPENRNWNGKTRKIRVELLGHPGVRIDYRRQYLAVDPGQLTTRVPPPTPMSIAMERGAPELSAIPLTVHAEASGTYVKDADHKPVLMPPGAPAPPKLRGTTANYNITCQIDANAIAFTQKDGTYIPQLATTVVAYDADGSVLNQALFAFTRPLTEGQYHAVLAKGLTLTNVFELPPGRTFLRVGVHDMQNQKIGSVEMPVIVTVPKDK